jgi:hypothetical protein
MVATPALVFVAAGRFASAPVRVTLAIAIT